MIGRLARGGACVEYSQAKHASKYHTLRLSTSTATPTTPCCDLREQGMQQPSLTVLYITE